jgi:hypothetical protein
MDHKPQTWVDKDDETAASSANNGPLANLVEQEAGSSAVEPAEATPSQPSTVSTDYATGTHEHDDDREAS